MFSQFQPPQSFMFSKSLNNQCYVDSSFVALDNLGQQNTTSNRQFWQPPSMNTAALQSQPYTNIYFASNHNSESQQHDAFKIETASVCNTDMDTKSVTSFASEYEYKLKTESLIKQYEIRLQKQEERHKLQLQKYQADIIILTNRLRSKETESQESKNSKNSSTPECPKCCNGEIINSLTAMLRSLEADHNHCLNYRKETTIKVLDLESTIDSLEKKLSYRNSSSEQTIKTLQEKVQQLEKQVEEAKSVAASAQQTIQYETIDSRPRSSLVYTQDRQSVVFEEKDNNGSRSEMRVLAQKLDNIRITQDNSYKTDRYRDIELSELRSKARSVMRERRAKENPRRYVVYDQDTFRPVAGLSDKKY